VLTIKEIKRLTYPDINEDFAKTIGFESLDDLMVKVRKRIEVDKKNWVEDDLKGQIFNILLEQIKFDLPQELVNYYTEKRAYKYQLDMLKGGISLEEIQKRTAAIKNASADSVARELRASLITERIAEKERIFVTENEVEQRIAAIAHAYNTDTSRVRKQLEHQGSLSNLRSEMRENKVVDFLLKEAKIEEESQATVKTKKKEAKSKE
jgi:trigger factor